MKIPIKNKLIWITMLTSSVALFLACASFATYEVFSFRRSMPAELSVLAQITGDNGKSALEFDDPTFAQETLLASLDANRHILMACIYNSQKKPFAKFLRKDQPSDTPVPQARAEGHYFEQDYLDLFHPVVADGKQIGVVLLRSDLDGLYGRISTYVGICAMVLIVSLGAAWLLSSQLQRIISSPILSLADAAAQVAQQKNYSLRVVKQSDDELGLLFDGFNKMLSEIEQRDVALQTAQNELEQRVAQRTSDLTQVNQSLTAEVTERERAETALRISQQKLEALINSIDGLVWEADPFTFEFTFVSQQAESLLGFPREQWTSDPTFWQDHLHPEDRSRAMEFFKEAVALCKPHHFEYRMRGIDGRVVWIRDSATVVSQDGKPALLRGVLQDITEQKLADQELEALNKRLLETSRQAGMAEVATGVLHNVGNVLNSVNVSATLVADKVRKSKRASLSKAAELLEQHKDDLPAFMASEKGRVFPGYLGSIAKKVEQDNEGMLEELESLTKNIEHIKDIVAMQQSYARVSGVFENILPRSLVEDAIQFNAAGFSRHGIELIRDYGDLPEVTLDKHKVLQILINILSNAKYAMEDNGARNKQLLITIRRHNEDRLRIAIKDNGMGIEPANLTRVFSHGFTTRRDGHGFGLHSGALAAKEMGGSLTAHSEGLGQGAAFILDLPIHRPQTQELAA